MATRIVVSDRAHLALVALPADIRVQRMLMVGVLSDMDKSRDWLHIHFGEYNQRIED